MKRLSISVSDDIDIFAQYVLDVVLSYFSKAKGAVSAAINSNKDLPEGLKSSLASDFTIEKDLKRLDFILNNKISVGVIFKLNGLM